MRPGGPYVAYSTLRLFEADFRSSATGERKGEQTVGHVANWSISGSGVVGCDQAFGENDPAAARETGGVGCRL